jgi:response regulator RpfG family c-di-GMP phosphodiesterase
LRRIKTNPVTQPIPAVVLTSSREERDLVESCKLGVNRYVQKPVEFAAFTQAVSELGMYWVLLNEPPASQPSGAAALPDRHRPSRARYHRLLESPMGSRRM